MNSPEASQSLQDRLSDYTLEQSVSLFKWACHDKIIRDQYQITKHTAGALLGQAALVGTLFATGTAPFWLAFVSAGVALGAGWPALMVAKELQQLQQKLVELLKPKLNDLDLQFICVDGEWNEEQRKKAVVLLYQYAPEEVGKLLKEWKSEALKDEGLEPLWTHLEAAAEARVEVGKDTVVQAWRRDRDRKAQGLPPEDMQEFKSKAPKP